MPTIPPPQPVQPDYEKLADIIVGKMAGDERFKGKDGIDGTVDYDKVKQLIDASVSDAIGKLPPGLTADQVTAIIQAAIAGIPQAEGCKCEPEIDAEHLVLVADQSADYWPRLKGEYDMAKGNYSAFKIAPPPPFSVQLPQLVLYRNNNPVKQKVGLREVSQALSSIYRGEKF